MASHLGTEPSAPARKRERVHRSVWWAGFLASFILHGLVLLLWRTAAPPSWETRSARERSDVVERALHAVQVATATTQSGPPPPARPSLAIDVPEIAMRDAEAVDLVADLAPVALVAAPRVEADDPGRALPEGGGANLPPMPRSILPGWVVPRAAQGMEIHVRVLVTSGGRAVGTVELDPPSPDRRFNRRIQERVRQIDYRPALVSGRPTAGWAEITFVFCPTTVTATSPPSKTPDRAPSCADVAGRRN